MKRPPVIIAKYTRSLIGSPHAPTLTTSMNSHAAELICEQVNLLIHLPDALPDAHRHAVALTLR